MSVTSGAGGPSSAGSSSTAGSPSTTGSPSAMGSSPTPIQLRIQKGIAFGIIIGLVYLLRYLLPVLFLTFILGYIGNTLVHRLTTRFPYRRFNLTLLYLVLIALLLLGVSVIVPRLFGEARDLARTYLASNGGDTAVVIVPTEYADPEVHHGARLMKPVVSLEAGVDTSVGADSSTVINRTTRKYLDIVVIQLLGSETLERFHESPAYRDLLVRVEDSVRDFIPRIVTGVTEFLNKLVVVLFHFVLSIIFSFIILWRLPELSVGAASFGRGRTAGLYNALAPGFRAFGRIIGKAFEAQTGIAIVNSFLTGLGFLALGIPSIALLSSIVFFCSYIPVLGVILSLLPAALLAFKVGGAITILWLIVMILVVHAIETYLLNPLIYGAHMHMEPIAVLVILLIGEHLFGIWGLLLGVPVTAFMVKYVIRGEEVA